MAISSVRELSKMPPHAARFPSALDILAAVVGIYPDSATRQFGLPAALHHGFLPTGLAVKVFTVAALERPFVSALLESSAGLALDVGGINLNNGGH
jgi:hypothetical protein